MKLAIDLGAIAHRIRRALWQVCCFQAYPGECHGCGARLTTDEAHYYGSNCERCEGVHMARPDRQEREHFGDPDKGTGIYAAGGADMEAERFCDGNCSWADHHPDCAIGRRDREFEEQKRANGWPF